MKHSGFVLMEIVVIVGMMALFVGLLSINLLGSQRRASLVGVVDTLVSDIQSQQTKAMTGFTTGGSVPAGYGVHFETSRYVLFSGSSYSVSDPTNSSIPLQSPVTLSSIGFAGGTLLFASKSGEVSGYVSGQDFVSVFHADSNQTTTIHINRYGVITSVN